MKIDVNIKSKGGLDINKKGIANVLQKGAFAIEQDAKKNIQHYKDTEDKLIDTGRMIRSITAKPAKIKPHEVSVEVGTEVEYAPYQEYGTSTIPARPFFRPAVDANIDKIVQNIAENIVEE